jgi:hypothetical protein
MRRPYPRSGSLRREITAWERRRNAECAKALTAEDVALAYKGGAIIESCFRRMTRAGLEVRPGTADAITSTLWRRPAGPDSVKRTIQPMPMPFPRRSIRPNHRPLRRPPRCTCREEGLSAPGDAAQALRRGLCLRGASR